MEDEVAADVVVAEEEAEVGVAEEETFKTTNRFPQILGKIMAKITMPVTVKIHKISDTAPMEDIIKDRLLGVQQKYSIELKMTTRVIITEAEGAESKGVGIKEVAKGEIDISKLKLFAKNTLFTLYIYNLRLLNL